MRENYTAPQGTCRTKAADSGGFARLTQNGSGKSKKTSMAYGLLLLIAFFSSGLASLYAQTTVSIGTGTSTSNQSPLNRFYGNSASELLYLGSEMGSAGVITSISFNKLGGSNNDPIESVTIYMKSTGEATVGTTTSLTGYTQVFSGSYTNTASPAWQTVTLTTPFVYPSTAANLSILVVKNFQQWTTSAESPKYAYTSTSANYRASYYQNDSTPWSATSSLTRTYNRPNIQLSLTALPAACAVADAAASVALSGVTSTSVTGTITAPATAPTGGYLVVRSAAATLTAQPEANVQYAAGAALGGGTVVTSGNSLTFTDATVSPNTHYYYFVYAYNYDSTFTCLGPAYSATAVSADTTTCSTFPVTIGVSNITSTTATLNWSSIAGAGGNTATYTVGVYTDAAYTTQVGTTYTTTSTSQNVTGLVNGTLYYYRIQGTTTGPCSDPTYATGTFTAQSNYTPISVTGFNFDVIANGTGLPGTSTDNDVDGGNYAYISRDYKFNATAAAATVGLPVNRILTNPTNADLKFILQDYTGNNSLRLALLNTTGTLTLTQPLKLSNVYLAVTSGSTTSNIDVQINFSDDTNETVSNISILDWFGTATTAQPALISGIGRVSRTGTTPETGASKIFQITVPVSAANQTKTVASLAIKNSTATGATASAKIPNVFAVSGQVVGSCPVMNAVTAASASATSINVSWTTLSVGDGATPTYTLEVYNNADFTSPVTGSPFTGLTGTTQLVSGLTFGNTYYFRAKAVTTACESAFVTGSTTIQYCIPTGTSTFYSVSNFTTTGGYSNIANATGAAAYTDYTTMVVSKAAGTSFDFSLTKSSATAKSEIYVDWNNDLDFTDAGETVAVLGNGPTVHTGAITIPAGTALGSYRLRIRTTYYSGYTLAPCGELYYSETEDYTVTVAVQPADCTTPDAPVLALSAVTASGITATVTPAATAIDITKYLIIRSTAATLSATPVNGASYAVGTDFGGGRVVVNGTALTTSDFLAANSHYYYYAFAYNDGGLTCFGPMYSTVATADSSTCAIATINSGASNIGNYAAKLNFTNVVGNGGSAATYTIEVYSSEAMTTLLNTYVSTTNSYALTGLNIATTYWYRVKATTTGCFNDAWSGLASFTTQSPYTPLDVTGYNADVIANGTGIANLSTTHAVDAVNNAYLALNYERVSGTVSTVGLPVNRIFTNTGITGMQFIFADYTGNNSLRLPAQNQAGTLTLTQPVKLSNLYLALTSGSGASTISAVVNFQDGTSQAASSFPLIDWYDPGSGTQPALFSNIGRVNRADSNGAIETGNSKVFYVTLPILEANQTKLVASVTITKTSAGATEPVPNIFAVSGKVIDECPVLNSVFPFATANGASITFGLLAGSSAATSFSLSVYTDEAMTVPIAGSPFTSATTSLTLTGLTASTTYYYSGTAINSACTSAALTGSFTTSCTTPDAPAAAAQTVCAGTTVAGLTATGATGATFKWYSSNTATTPLAATATVTAGLYFVSQTVSTCESTRTSVTVTVNTVAVPVVTPLTFCGSATAAELTATALEGATLTWYATVGGTPLEATAALAATNYYVTQTLNGCTSAPATVAVSIRSLPILPTAAAQTFCSGATVADLEVTGSETATFNWSLTEGGTPLAATALLVSGTYYVSQTIDPCTGPALAVVVTVNPTPDAPVAASQNFCEGATIADITVSGDGDGTITWYATADGAPIAETTTLVTGSYFVAVTVGTCTSALTEVAVIVSPVPVAPIAVPQTFCSGATASELTASGVQGATFAWFTDAEGTAPLSPTTTLQTGTYYVAQLTGNCISTLISVSVTVNETPDAPAAAAEQSFTEGETVADLEVTLAEGATANWYVLTDGEYVAVETTTALVDDVTYYVTQTTGTCTSDYTPVTANLTANTDQFGTKSLTVYPNPANNVLNITSTENITHLVLNNLLGQKVLEQKANGTNTQLNVSSLAAGTYLLQVTAGSKSGTIKIVKN
jgi:hypothetical protein